MKKKLKSGIKKIVGNVKTQYHQYESIQQAKSSLYTIESIKGKTNPQLIKQANSYAIEVLGSQAYAPWLRAYSAMCGSFKEGWIPENYFGKVVVPKYQGETGATSFLKTLTNKIFAETISPDIAYFVNGSFYSKDYQLLAREEIANYLFRGREKVVFKINNSFQGKGVYILAKERWIESVQRLGDGVFQKFIQQHPFFDAIMPHSVATVRMLTVITRDGEAEIRAAYLRVGRSSDKHVASNSQISIPIDLKSGELYATGYRASWYALNQHPDSGFVFTEKKMPLFEKLKQKALKLQSKMAFVKCIGWDLTVDHEDNIEIIEWNGFHTGIGFAEFTQGPCFNGLGWEHLWIH